MWQAFCLEVPAFVHLGTGLHTVWAWRESQLDYTIRIDQHVPRISVDPVPATDKSHVEIGFCCGPLAIAFRSSRVMAHLARCTARQFAQMFAQMSHTHVNVKWGVRSL